MTRLTELRDHARRMSEEPDTPAAEADLWTQLADEIDEYLDGTRDDEPNLFDV